VFNFSGVWALPIRFQSHLTNFFAGGWNTTSIVAWRSGFPFTIVSGQDNARTGRGSQRADLTGVSPYLSNDGHGAIAAQYMNRRRSRSMRSEATACWDAILTGVRAPSTWVSASTRISTLNEKQKFQFRFESFNLFNNVNLGNPNTTVTSGNFMKITRAVIPESCSLR